MKAMITKHINRSWLAFLLIGVMLMACEEEESAPEMSAFFKTYAAEELEAPADLVFINGSKNGLSYHWDFGDAYLKNDPDRSNSYTGISPDTVHFALPGSYDITVRVKGSEGQEDVTYTQTLQFAKKQPVISYSPESILNDTAVYFTVDYLRFEDKTPSFEWTFEDGEPATSTQESPVVQFQAAGEKLVQLKLNDGEEVLTVTTTVTVQSTLSPTLYFTDMNAKEVFMFKLSGEVDEEVTSTGAVLPDGSLPMNMIVDEGRVYYSNTDGSRGTATFGEIKSFKWDGTDHNVIISGGSGQFVPFSMTIDGQDLYFTNRRDGIFKVNKTATGQSMPVAADALWLNDDDTEFGFSWGSQNGALAFYEGKLWWSKCSNSQGMYTISPTKPTNGAGEVTGEMFLENYPIRSFTIDESTGRIYFFINKKVGDNDIGLYGSNVDGSDLIPIETYEPEIDFDGSGGNLEYVGVTGIAVIGEYIYWGYRDNGNAVATSGVKRAKLDGTEVEMFLPGYVPYGLTIDKTPR